MKKAILFICAIAITSYSFAQNEMKDDTTKIKIGNITIIVENDSTETEDYSADTDSVDLDEDDGSGLSIDIGMNGYLSAGNTMSLPNSVQMMELDYGKSRTFALNFMHKGFEFANEHVYIKPGIGFSWNNYFFKNNVAISTGSDTTVFSLDTVTSYKKYKFRTSYIQIPIVAGLRLGDVNNKPFGIQAGIIGGYSLNNVIKQKVLNGETYYKNRIKDDFNVAPLKLEAVARLSIGGFGLFGKYNITSLFENGKAPIVYPFAIGFTFGGF